MNYQIKPLMYTKLILRCKDQLFSSCALLLILWCILLDITHPLGHDLVCLIKAKHVDSPLYESSNKVHSIQQTRSIQLKNYKLLSG